MKFKRIVFLIFVLFLFTNMCFAYSDSIKLLAVSTDDNFTYQGTVAQMFLKLNEGTGKVYFDTSSLTKLDTQLSIKISQEIACNYLRDKINCDDYDFLYSIDADSNIVGGPSAGAAATILTISALEQIPVNQSISITGTINSGGYIGDVGGVNEKLSAAEQNGLDMVIVPYEASNISNHTIVVKKIYDIDNALYYFTNGNLGSLENNYDVDESQLYHEYNNKMKLISDLICTRMESLKIDNHSNELYTVAIDALDQKQYYSAASFCFRTNIEYQTNILENSNANFTELYNNLSLTYEKELDSINAHNVTSIQDLQVKMIIKNRLDDLKYYLDSINNTLNNASLNISEYNYAYSIERLETINAWKIFFDNNSTDLTISNDKLQKICLSKVQETQTRLDYLNYLVPGLSESINIETAFEELALLNDSIECINSAAYLKARIDVILSLLSNQNSTELYNIKSFLALKSIQDNIDDDNLPIMGFSYYEYAKSLHNTNSTNDALIYLQQTIELNNINKLFEQDKINTYNQSKQIKISKYLIYIGLLLIVFVVLIIILRINKSQKAKKHKKNLKIDVNFNQIKSKIKKLNK